MWANTSNLLIVGAAFCKAMADTLADHFDSSLFKNWNPKFWQKSVSSEYAKVVPFTKYKWDGWHLANSGMIVCFCLAIVLHNNIFKWYWELLAAGVVFNLSFNFFYNKILR